MLERARRAGLIGSRPEAAIDSTGLDATVRSTHYARRLGKRYRMKRWPKLTLVTDTCSHLILAAHHSIGPSQDYPLLEAAMLQAAWNLPGDLTIDRLLADGGYDSEDNHRLSRQGLGIRSTVINLNRRGKGPAGRPSPRKWARTRYRRQMYRRFHRRKYGQRWQAESAISRFKRRLGFALRGRSDASRERESNMRVATHNLMLLAAGP